MYSQPHVEQEEIDTDSDSDDNEPDFKVCN